MQLGLMLLEQHHKCLVFQRRDRNSTNVSLMIVDIANFLYLAIDLHHLDVMLNRLVMVSLPT